MPIVRGFIPPRFADEWSFSGRGRMIVKRAVPQKGTGILEGDGPARQPQPLDPGEPRG